MSAAEVLSMPARYSLPLELIVESKTNPRKNFDKTKLQELADSITKRGVLQPILVRPIAGKYEVVAGHRRFRAAGLAKLEEIPATVQELDDKAVLEIQMIENLQREDLHPLEEAEGYASLLHSHGYTADELAAKLGKSRGYVYARMKLADLAEPVKKALWDGSLSHSIALLVARIPDKKLQVEAFKEVAGLRFANGEPMSYRRASECIQREFMNRLADAPFDTASAQLLPRAGACTTCPMRTGNQVELFADVKNKDICTSPGCYREKLAAFLKIKAEKESCRAMTAAQLADAEAQGFGASKFVRAADPAYDIGVYNKPYAQVVPQKTPVYLGIDYGKVAKFYAKRDLPKRKVRESRSSSSPAAQRERESKWKREREIREATDTALRDALWKEATAPNVNQNVQAVFSAIAAGVCVQTSYDFKDTIEKLKLPALKLKRSVGKEAAEENGSAIVDYVASLRVHQQAILVGTLMFIGGSLDYGEVEASPARNAFFQVFGIDAEKLAADAEAVIAAKYEDKKKPAKKKGGRA